jgi:multicomponent Na+:H+ antiporter subunit C
MDGGTLFGLCGAALVAIGVYGLVVRTHLLRRLIGFNMVGSGIFLLLGGLAARAGSGVDPVPQAMIITGIVVALAGTAVGLALVVRAHEAGTAGDDDAGGG